MDCNKKTQNLITLFNKVVTEQMAIFLLQRLKQYSENKVFEFYRDLYRRFGNRRTQTAAPAKKPGFGKPGSHCF